MKWKFWKSEDSDNSRPPRPETETRTEERSRVVKEVTIHYRNGDTESIECYQHYQQEDYFEVVTVPQFEPNYHHAHGDKQFHYETLAREPEIEGLRKETFKLTYKTTYHWRERREEWQGSEGLVSRELIDSEEIESE